MNVKCLYDLLWNLYVNMNMLFVFFTLNEMKDLNFYEIPQFRTQIYLLVNSHKFGAHCE